MAELFARLNELFRRVQFCSEQLRASIGFPSRSGFDLRAAVIGLKPVPHPDTPTFVLTADQSFDAASGSKPAVLGLRTFGLPLMLPNPFGPT